MTKFGDELGVGGSGVFLGFEIKLKWGVVGGLFEANGE
jgi:hypothetical protein